MSGLWYAFREGGWAMYVIFALGLPGVGAAGRFAWRGEHLLLGFLRWIAFTLLASGAFGFSVGYQKVLRAMVTGVDGLLPAEHLSSDHRIKILLVGTREALSCISASLMFVVVIGALGAVGQRRFPQPNPSAVPR